jgi:ADP-glucose pyrophosphorylase
MAVQRNAEELFYHQRAGTDALGERSLVPRTADAIYQNINLIEQSDPNLVAIFGGDHIYRMNVASMIDFHKAKRAEVTVAAIPVPRVHAAEFGVIEANQDGRILAFHEKRPNAPTMPGDSSRVYASMGNYIFSTHTLDRSRPLAIKLKNDYDDHHDLTNPRGIYDGCTELDGGGSQGKVQ